MLLLICLHQLLLGLDIAQMVADGKKEGLRLIAYHCVQNGFDGIVFCDVERGINGATPAEILHVWQHGLFPRALAVLFGQKRLLKRAFRRKKLIVHSGSQTNHRNRQGAPVLLPFADNNNNESDSDADDNEEDEVEHEMEEVIEYVSESDPPESADIEDGDQPTCQKDWNLSNNGIFTDTAKKDFDSRAKKYGRILAHQSNCEFDISYFPSDITTNAKKERKNQLLNSFFTLLRPFSRPTRELERFCLPTQWLRAMDNFS
jgi:hypothetical protein